jgi:hypothetical protein
MVLQDFGDEAGILLGLRKKLVEKKMMTNVVYHRLPQFVGNIELGTKFVDAHS